MAGAGAPVGRAHEAEQALSALSTGNSVLVRGRAGIGKTELIRHIHTRLQAQGETVVWTPDGPAKVTVEGLLRQLHEALGLVMPASMLGPRLRARAQREGGLSWQELARTFRRLPVAECGDIIVATLKKAPVVVCIDTLEVPPQKADLFKRILEVAQVVAGIDDTNRRTRIEKMLWRFQFTIELKPLSVDASEQLVNEWLRNHHLRFSCERTRRRFVRHVAQDSGGIPAAILGMLEQAEKEGEITPAKARGFSHQAGVSYLDMTPLLVVAIVVAMAARYISRGIGETDMLVLSGVASALFMGLRFFFWQMRAR